MNIFILQFYFLCKLFPVLTHLIFHFWQAVEVIVVSIKTKKTCNKNNNNDRKHFINWQQAELGRKCKLNKLFLSPAFFLINVNLFNISILSIIDLLLSGKKFSENYRLSVSPAISYVMDRGQDWTGSLQNLSCLELWSWL